MVSRSLFRCSGRVSQKCSHGCPIRWRFASVAILKNGCRTSLKEGLYGKKVLSVDRGKEICKQGQVIFQKSIWTTLRVLYCLVGLVLPTTFEPLGFRPQFDAPVPNERRPPIPLVDASHLTNYPPQLSHAATSKLCPSLGHAKSSDIELRGR